MVSEQGLPAPCVSAVKTAMPAPSAAVSVAAWSCANTSGKYSFGGTKQPMSMQHCWPAFSGSASLITWTVNRVPKSASSLENREYWKTWSTYSPGYLQDLISRLCCACYGAEGGGQETGGWGQRTGLCTFNASCSHAADIMHSTHCLPLTLWLADQKSCGPYQGWQTWLACSTVRNQILTPQQQHGAASACHVAINYVSHQPC